MQSGLEFANPSSSSDAMSFEKHLSLVVNGAEGSLTCLLMGQDGIPVESYDHPSASLPFDSNTFATEYTGLFHQISTINQLTSAGSARELMVASENVVALFHFVSPEYFLLLTLAPNGNIGKARYLLRLSASQLLRELQ